MSNERLWGEGPDGDKDVLAYINEEPVLLSLLYDLDLMPEQHPDRDSPAWEKIFTITCHWREANRRALDSPEREAKRSKLVDYNLRWALAALDLVGNGLRNRRGLEENDVEMINLKAAKASIENARENAAQEIALPARMGTTVDRLDSRPAPVESGLSATSEVVRAEAVVSESPVAAPAPRATEQAPSGLALDRDGDFLEPLPPSPKGKE